MALVWVGHCLTRVVEELFADVKESFVFNDLGDLVVYSRSVEENAQHVRTVSRRLRDAGFTLNCTKMTNGAREVIYLGTVCHLVASLSCRIEWLPSGNFLGVPI
jgi:hypothetical protein